MHTSKLIQLLSVFNEKELLEFPKYAAYLGRKPNPDALKLFKYLVRFAPNFTSNRLKREMVCRHLFKDFEITTSRLNKIAHPLKILLEDFLVHYDIQQNNLFKKRMLLKGLKKRNHPNFLEDSKTLINEIGLEKDDNNNLDLFQLNHAVWSDINTEKISADIDYFKNANEYLDNFFYLQKLEIILEYNASKFIRNSDFDLVQHEEVLALIETHPTLKSTVIVKLLLAAIQMQKSNERADFLALKVLFFESIAALSKKDALLIFVLLNNFYNQHLWTDQSFFANQGFELYQFAEIHELLMENGRIRDLEYGNAATVGFFAYEDEWTFDFIEKYKSKLSPKVRKATYAQVNAYFHFRQKEFDKVINLLNPIERNEKLSLATAIKIRTLKLRAFFELWLIGENDLQQVLESQIKSFEKYIRKHEKLAKSKKQIYFLFSRLFKRIVNLKGTYNQRIVKLSAIETDFKNLKFIIYRDWMEEKIQQLKSTYLTKI